MINEGIDGSQPSPVAADAPIHEYLTLGMLAHGQQARIFTVSDVQKIQSEILVLLQEKIKQYNHSESSSVRVDTAEYILRSILYTMDFYLMAYNDEQKLSLLKRSTVYSIYQLGLEALEEQLEGSRLLYQQVARNSLDKGTFAYNSTIEQAIPDFFRKYDLAFGAHDTITSIDYPVYNDDQAVSGIRYIKQYLQKLDLENRFCLTFSQSSITGLLQKYGHIYGIDYRDTLANISEIVLGNGIFAELVGDYPGSLKISPLQFRVLQELLHPMQEQAILALIDRSQAKLLDHLGLTDSRFSSYFSDFPANLTPRIIQALKNDSLANIIVLDPVPSNRSFQQFFQGPKLDPKSFRMLVDYLLQCSDSSSKIHLIGRQVKSLDDFLDILEAGCLDREDYLSLFKTLGNLELSFLLRAVLPEAVRCQDFEQILVSLDSPCNQEDWRTVLKQILAELPEDRFKAVEKFIYS